MQITGIRPRRAGAIYGNSTSGARISTHAPRSAIYHAAVSYIERSGSAMIPDIKSVAICPCGSRAVYVNDANSSCVIANHRNIITYCATVKDIERSGSGCAYLHLPAIQCPGRAGAGYRSSTSSPRDESNLTQPPATHRTSMGHIKRASSMTTHIYVTAIRPCGSGAVYCNGAGTVCIVANYPKRIIYRTAVKDIQRAGSPNAYIKIGAIRQC